MGGRTLAFHGRDGSGQSRGGEGQRRERGREEGGREDLRCSNTDNTQTRGSGRASLFCSEDRRDGRGGKGRNTNNSGDKEMRRGADTQSGDRGPSESGNW